MYFTKCFFLATAATVCAAVDLNFIYSRGDFATISNGIGNEFGHSTGLTITTSDGVELYGESYPAGGSPCANPHMGLTMTSSCWDGEYYFDCGADNYANYQGCSVTASDDIKYDGVVDKSINFIGIAISVEGTCGGGFKSFYDCGEGATFEVTGQDY